MDNISFGAFTVNSLADYNRSVEEAEKQYESIRKRSTDVINISTRVGISYEKISLVKQYVFFATHDLGKETPCRFPADLDMARSWLRLAENTRGHKGILDHDLILIKHELLEIEILLKTGCTQAKAHEAASKRYNYSVAADEYYKRKK